MKTLYSLLNIRLLPLYVFSIIVPLITYSYAIGRDYHYGSVLFAFFCVMFPIRYRYCSFTHNTRIYIFFSFIVALSSINLIEGMNVKQPFYQMFAYSLVPYCTIVYIFMETRMIKDANKYIEIYGVILFALGIYRFFRSEQIQSVIGATQWANNAFYYSLMCLPLVLLSKNNFIRTTAILFSFGICILSVKRTALIAIVVIGIIYLFQSVRFRSRYRRLFAVLGIIILAYILQDNAIVNSIDAVNNRMEQLQDDGGSGRDVMYLHFLKSDAMDIIHFPEFFFGKGFKGYRRKYNNTVEAVHNDYMELFYSYGIFGLLFMSWFLFKTLKDLQFFRKIPEYSLAYWSFTILFTIYSFTGGVFSFVYTMLPMYIFIGYMETVKADLQFDKKRINGHVKKN